METMSNKQQGIISKKYAAAMKDAQEIVNNSTCELAGHNPLNCGKLGMLISYFQCDSSCEALWDVCDTRVIHNH